MAARLSPVEFYERDVRPRLRVEDVYGDVRFSSKRGRRWRGPCPLHNGTNPQNFSVDTETLGWTCFSTCQRSGSALAFLNGGDWPRGADFVALVRKLAERVGVDTSPLDRPQRSRGRGPSRGGGTPGGIFERFLGQARNALQTTAGTEARAYLEGRGFSGEELVDVGFGLYSSPEDVEAGLTVHGFSRDELKAAGLLSPAWTGRLVFPWRDRTGHVGGFVARDLTGKAEGNISTPPGSRRRTPWRSASTWRSGNGRGEIVLVEGLLDVLLLQSRGVLNVAAIGGAGGEFSPSRWEALERFGVRRVTLLLDNDEPGKEGTRKALENLHNVPVTFKVDVVSPEALGDAKDPDEYVRAHSVEAFRDVLTLAVPWAFYKARTLLEGVDPEAPVSRRREAVERVIDFVAGLRHETAGLDREDVLRETAERTGYSKEELSGIAEKGILTRQRHDAERSLKAAVKNAENALARGESPADVARTLIVDVAHVKTVSVEDPLPFDVDRLIAEAGQARSGRPSGWDSLDRSEKDGGLGLRFNAGELALMAARTGHGKTSVLVGLLHHWLLTLSEDELVVFYSLEEPEGRVLHRLVALVTYGAEGSGPRTRSGTTSRTGTRRRMGRTGRRVHAREGP